PRLRQRHAPYVCPAPPDRLLPRGLKPKLVCFMTRNRVFLKLVSGRRVIGSANDLLGEWHMARRPGKP
ncbi:hypothetical protein JXD38_05515, partial [candidate division WOR-3 bacterium]|nr:hypothetical protein [candidate division WOR-3 bacterium]